MSGELPPFHLKVPVEHWPILRDVMHQYGGKVYIDSVTMHYPTLIYDAFRRTERVFARRPTRRKALTVMLPRKALTWLLPLLDRIAADAAALAHRKFKPWVDYESGDCDALSVFVTRMRDLIIEDARKSVIDFIGEIQT